MKAEIIKILDRGGDYDSQLVMLRAISPHWVKILKAPDEPTKSQEKIKEEPVKIQSRTGLAKKEDKKSRGKAFGVVHESEIIQTVKGPETTGNKGVVAGAPGNNKDEKILKNFEKHQIERLLAMAASDQQVFLERGIIVTRYRGEIPIRHAHLFKDGGCKFYNQACLNEALKRRWSSFTCVNCPHFSK